MAKRRNGNGRNTKVIHVGRVAVYLLNGAWHGRWTDSGGARVSKRLVEKGDSQKAAIAVAKKIDKAATAGALGGDPLEQKRRQLAPLVKEYATRLERKGESKHVATVIGAITRVFQATHCRRISDVTVEKVDAFFDQLASPQNGKEPTSAGTLNHYRGYLRSFFKWLEDCDKIDKSPLRRLETRDGHPVRRRQADKPHEIARVLEAAKAGKAYEHAAYMLGYGAGLRQNEILNLRWGDIDLEKGLYKIISSRQKGGHDTLNPILPELVAFLKELREERARQLGRPPADEDPVIPNAPRNAKTLSSDRKATIERAGLRYRGLDGEVDDWHAMRHAFCSNLSDAEGDIKTKQLLMRHADISTTAGYAHADIKAQRDMLNNSAHLLGGNGKK